jgi:hypothetical protein
VQRGKEERTSGAEALVSSAFYGTAEAVPFVKSGFFLDGLISRSAVRHGFSRIHYTAIMYGLKLAAARQAVPFREASFSAAS